MPCTSRLYQKDQGIVIGWKQNFLQCCGHWSITFQTWLVLGNSVIKLSDIFHQWGQIYGYKSILYFPVFITTILNLRRVSHNQISNIEIDIYHRVLCPPYRAFYLKCPYPLLCKLHCSAETFFSGRAKKLSHKTEKAEL